MATVLYRSHCQVLHFSRMQDGVVRCFGAIGAFGMTMVVMLFVCVFAWDAFVNGKVYYCTDGGSMDFVVGVGDWVHNPESVQRVGPRSMSQPDEIKAGWTVTGLRCLWYGFIAASALVSALLAGALWRAQSPATRRTRVVEQGDFVLHHKRLLILLIVVGASIRLPKVIMPIWISSRFGVLSKWFLAADESFGLIEAIFPPPSASVKPGNPSGGL